ncbi:MAG TPA: hypothetical protein VMF50_18830 [Candidatus Binataceae bacterium]|nr:hypothetical protein [Candidatus Binataceae bacterium]
MLTKAKFLLRLPLAALALAATSCNGFGTTNITSPGSTSNKPPQVSFRVVGRIGEPFSLYISDARSSWTVKGVVPLTVIIVNEASPVRLSATKLINDNSLLSIEVIAGFTVKALASSTTGFGIVPDGFQQPAQRQLPYAPAASPDVRFYVKGPATEVFDALIEDQKESNALETRVPAVIIFDSPDTSANIDGIFTAVTITGDLDIDMTCNGAIVTAGVGGTKQTLKSTCAPD